MIYIYIDTKALGERLKFARISKGYTQHKLAKLINKCDEYVNKIENGNANPSIEVLGNICDKLELSLPYLVSGIEIKEKNYLRKEINDSIKKLSDDQKRALIILARTVKKLNN